MIRFFCKQTQVCLKKVCNLNYLHNFPHSTKMSDISETKLILSTDPCAVQVASKELEDGCVVAVPTDTIYGFAALSQNDSAIAKLYEIKKRTLTKPIAICVAEVEEIYDWAEVTVSSALLNDLLPGAVTVVFNRSPTLNPRLNPGTDLVGIRVPDNALVRQLCRECSQPLALTSANVSAQQSSVAIQEFQPLWPQLAVVLDGGVLGQTPASRAGSTVVDLSCAGHYKIIRPGSALETTVKVLQRYRLEES